jgi:hypothetical protein
LLLAILNTVAFQTLPIKKRSKDCRTLGAHDRRESTR